jgi:hypothetical protein
MTRTKADITDERCASPRCGRVLTGRGVIVARDGRRFCKHHGDRLRATYAAPSLARPRKSPEPHDRREPDPGSLLLR